VAAVLQVVTKALTLLAEVQVAEEEVAAVVPVKPEHQVLLAKAIEEEMEQLPGKIMVAQVEVEKMLQVKMVIPLMAVQAEVELTGSL
jgi:hypothetical protein